MIIVGMEDGAMAIHPTAVVHPNAKLGSGVRVGPGSVIGEHVSIGEGTQISANVVIGGWTTIGKHCEIYPNAAIGLEPQDLKFANEKSYCIVGDYTVIRESVTIHRATGEGEYTKVGNHCLLQACTHVAHNCVLGDYVIMSSFAGLAGHVIVEDRAIIGGMAGVHQFVKIGRNAMIGGMSKAVQDIPPFVIADGQPARVVTLNSVGLARAGISQDVRKNLKQAFRILFRSGLSLSDAIREMESQLESSEEMEHMLRFLRNAERGIARVRKEM